jgi:hypothetical protein
LSVLNIDKTSGENSESPTTSKIGNMAMKIKTTVNPRKITQCFLTSYITLSSGSRFNAL